jgi:hypothetical protein
VSTFHSGRGTPTGAPGCSSLRPCARRARTTGGALEIAHPLASEDQVAAGEADRDRVAHLAGRGRRGRLVETRHPLGDLSLADLRGAVEGDRRHLQVDVAQLTAERLGLRAPLPRPRRVARQRERRFAQREPALFLCPPATFE